MSGEQSPEKNRNLPVSADDLEPLTPGVVPFFAGDRKRSHEDPDQNVKPSVEDHEERARRSLTRKDYAEIGRTLMNVGPSNHEPPVNEVHTNDYLG